MSAKIDEHRRVILRPLYGDKVTLTCDWPKFQAAAIRWSRSLRNRRRWLTSDAIIERRRQAVEQAAEIFIELKNAQKHREIVTRLANGGIVEVTLPAFESEAKDWALRIFPWEYFLSTLTRETRKAQQPALPFLITRVLPLEQSAGDYATIADDNILMAQCAPEPLEALYSFRSEVELMRINLDLKDWDFVLSNPNSVELKERIAAQSPGLVHLAGFDLHQALRYLPPQITEGVGRHEDGFIISDPQGVAVVLKPEELAEIINAGAQKPALVSVNVYNSAARLCALAVALGAKVAVGFQDEIDDHLAEIFFASLYRAWHNDPDTYILPAFQEAFEETRKLPDEYRMQGSGIVLWSNTSLLYQISGRERTLPLTEQPSTGTGGGVGDLLLDIAPYRHLNYAILHNRGHLFTQFNVTRTSRSSPDKVHVEVVARVGAQEYPYRGSHSTGEVGKPEDIGKYIRIPLSWDYLRTLSETLRTTVYVRITAHDNVIEEKTYQVDVAPLEEWSDTDEDRIWLPSFVLPRDIAVIDAVAGARRYLSALSDDPNAGFDGYQSYGLYADDPYGPVDIQVRTIWTALVLDHRLQYINPPPSYYAKAQRVRSPSEVLRRSHGTCIDLTLLLAACLEYIEIHPVLFLIEGHAFPGYWRSPQQADYFVQGDYPDGQTDADELTEDMGTPSWMYSKAHLERIYAFVSAGHLVPIESTLLTSNSGFFAACDAGIESLSDPDRFQFLIDVRRARSDPQGATPLPINNQMP
ncbi:MAG: hypothetical protein MI756_02190 [Chromatiales bacterium]|nr:hypothetical protein [Chromatiales bacterium]